MKIVNDTTTARGKLSNTIDMTKATIASACWEHVCEQSDDHEFGMTILKLSVSGELKAKTSEMND